MDQRVRLTAIIVAFALPVFAGPAVSSAAPKPVPTSESADFGPSQQAFSVNGRIESVDYTSNVIVVRGKHGDSSSISLTPTTSVELSGQQGGISDLRPGMHVRVKGTVVGGVMTAESIVVVR